MCHICGGGTRSETKWRVDPATGKSVPRQRGYTNVPARIQALLDGDLDVRDLDDEELARGYPRAADGTFRRAPKLVPRSLHDRMIRELFSRADEMLRGNLMKSVEVMTSIAANPEVDPAQRLKAAQWVYERVRGKVPDLVVTADVKKWEEVLDGVYRGPRPATVDGEVLDDGREP